MGYRSDVVIAIDLSIVAEHLISPIIPEVLLEEPYQDHAGARYWHIEGWKWYDSYSEIQSIESFFNELNEREPLQVKEGSHTYPKTLYGAIRIGEEMGDIEEWGDPSTYEIYPQQCISSPLL